ncbi:MAG: hypothetical protein V7765_07935 [Oleispira sp.]
MSLVNDVLRELDDRSELPGHGLSFPGLINNKEVAIRRPYQSLLVIIIFMLVVILSIQLIFNKPLMQLLSSNFDANEISELIGSESSSIKTEELAPVITSSEQRGDRLELNQSIALKAAMVLEETKQSPIILEREFSTPKELKSSNKLTTPAKSKAPIGFKAPSPIEAFEESIVAIKKVEVAGKYHYQRAIKEYKQQRYTSALISINSAIRESEDEKYQVLKARILLKQQNNLGFVQFIQQQSDNTSLNWFQLVAPGLQLLSYYELSNQYYLQLIKQQPESIKWPLAMALNYSKLNKIDKTLGIYQSLLQSSLLSNKQRKWILSQIQSMNQLMAKKEGQRYGS